MLDAIKRLLGMDSLPRETEQIYLEAKDEEDAIRRLREEKGRTVRHRERIIEDLGVLETKEKEFLAEGRGTDSPIRREVLARQVAEIREQAAAFLNRVDILTRKIAVFDRHLDLLKDRGILSGPMPDPSFLERAAGDVDAARRALEDLIDLTEATEGVSEFRTGHQAEEEILGEMDGSAEKESAPSFDEMVERESRRRRPRSEPDKEPPLAE
jgi:hypothetical protein